VGWQTPEQVFPGRIRGKGRVSASGHSFPIRARRVPG
jgi:hypothetical protein